jgi:tetratricopeptide (TPR) repeat protein/transcriptional regulator with XRE-family HTH domain
VEIDPERIHTAEQLVEQLGELYRQGGWSIHRLAEKSGLSTATVQAILNGTTELPRTGTLRAFVIACGQDPNSWVSARGRAVKATQTAKSRLRVVNVPRVESTFVGRTAELQQLTRALRPPSIRPGAARSTRTGVVVHAVHGLGGVGKSTLAARWARTHLDELEVAWWITADTTTGVEAGLAGLAVAVQPELAGQPLGTLAAHAIGWLAANRSWLLVLDNVTNPADVAPLLDRDLPGQIVVTSRLAEGWHRLGATVIRLNVLNEQQALKLLTTIASHDRDEPDPTSAAELVRELGLLPLAVDQAAAYLHQTRLNPAAYLDMLRQNPAVMYDQTARGSDAERSIARIWRITLDTLADTQLAGQLLRIMAWCAPEAIPRTLLASIADATEVAAALGSLAAYNMITLDTVTVTVHRLVQAVARTPDSTDPHRQPDDIATARHQATHILCDNCPDDYRAPDNWAAMRVLLPHIDALARHSSPATDTETTSSLLTFTGVFLAGQGDNVRAINYLKRCLTFTQRLHGSDHPETLRSKNNLAYIYQNAGQLKWAIPLLEETLADRERVLGVDHHETLASRNNLAYTYRAAADPERAIPLLESALTASERVLGVDHRDTLTVRNNLALTYDQAGYSERAIRLHRATLTVRKRTLDTNHPDILQSQNNLALAHLHVGHLRRAIALLEMVLAAGERIQGADHPETLRTRINLADAHRRSGRLRQAISLSEAALAACERALGPDHPHTLAAQSSLANAYREFGDLGQAISLYKRTLVSHEQVLGVDHPEALTSRKNLADAYVKAEDMKRARPLYKRLLADCERVLGRNHPLTKRVQEILATLGEGASRNVDLPGHSESRTNGAHEP